jgi:hypothetical protein
MKKFEPEEKAYSLKDNKYVQIVESIDDETYKCILLGQEASSES